MTEHATSSTERHNGVVSVKPLRDDLLFLLHLPDDETTDSLELAGVVEAVRQRLNGYQEALERIAQYDLTKERSGVNVAVLQGIARDALHGPDDYGWVELFAGGRWPAR